MLLPNVQNVIKRFATAVTLNRPGAAQVANGLVNRAAATTSTIQAVVQPMTPRQIERLPEGERASDWRNIWSLTELKLNDRLTIGGVTYVVGQQSDWLEAGAYWFTPARRDPVTL